MTERRIRLHDSTDHQSSIFGFGLGIEPNKRADLETFLHEQGYETRSFNAWGHEVSERDSAIIRDLGTASLYYLEVHPPVRDEHLAEFARRCAEGATSGSDTGVLLDDRKSPSYDGSEHAGVLARW